MAGKVTGADRVMRNLKRIAEDSLKAFGGALYAEGNHIIDKSIDNVPVQTSRLRNSNFVTLPGNPRRPKILFGYGTKYAFRVHEGIVTRIKDMPRRQQQAAFASMRKTGFKRSEVGGPKYLENAVDQTASGRERRIARTVSRYAKMRIGILPTDKAKTVTEARAKANSAGGDKRR